MSDYVVDASAAAKWFFDEPHAEAARVLLRPGIRLSAPDFLLVEMDNLFCKRVRRGDMTREDADDARVLLRQLPVEFHPSAALHEQAYELAHRTRRSLYDCFYLSLAILLDAPMVTADRRLFDALGKGAFSAHVMWVEATATRPD